MAAGEVVATATFVTWHDGVEVTANEGDRLKADHAIVQAQPQWFKPAPKAKPRKR
jgi:hypothetical protein